MNKVQLTGEFKNFTGGRSQKTNSNFYAFTITNYDDPKFSHTIPCVIFTKEDMNFDGITTISIEGKIIRRKRIMKDTGKEIYETKILVDKILDKNFEVQKNDFEYDRNNRKNY